MISMKLINKVLTLACVSVFVIAGCTSKDNTVGIDREKDTPLTIKIDSDSLFSYIYSYSDSVGPSFPNNKLITGDFKDNHSITLMRFGNLPREGFVIAADAKLNLNISGKFETEGMLLKLALIEQEWSQREATWSQADIDTAWKKNWSNSSNLSILSTTEVSEDDSLAFIIPKDEIQKVVEDWISEEPSTFGLAVIAESNVTDSYVEFFDKDNRESRPELLFKFRQQDDSEEDELRDYQRPPVYNTFINSIELKNGISLKENEFIVSNLPPNDIVVKLDTDFVKNEILRKDNVLTAEELKRVTINRADLILSIDEQRSHYSPSVQQVSVRPFNLMEEFADKSELPIEEKLTELLLDNYGSTNHLGQEKININITSTLQAYISGLRDNHGMMLKSTVERADNTFLLAENRDNTYIVFFNHKADESLRPYLKVTYTRSPF